MSVKSAPCLAQVVDKAPRPSINNVIWILSFRYLSAQPIFSNSEAAVLSKINRRHFQNILSNSVNLEGPLLEPALSRQIEETIEKAFRIY